MGCAVNGPGEAGNADFGIAGGRDAGFIYAHGEVLRKVPQAVLVDELFREIDAWIERGMPRPERGSADARDRGRRRMIWRVTKLVAVGMAIHRAVTNRPWRSLRGRSSGSRSAARQPLARRRSAAK